MLRVVCDMPVRVLFPSRSRRLAVANYHAPLAVQLLDEGAVQMLRERSDDGNGNPILAAVGTLQFDGEYAFSEHGFGAPAGACSSLEFHSRLRRLTTRSIRPLGTSAF